MFGYPPNIIGSATRFYSELEDEYLTGCFYSEDGGQSKVTDKAWQSNKKLMLDAARCSSLYTTGSTLQPSALSVLACIKL